jgi:hypothetical protein
MSDEQKTTRKNCILDQLSRYDIAGVYDYYMALRHDGDYVKFDDVAELLARILLDQNVPPIT